MPCINGIVAHTLTHEMVADRKTSESVLFQRPPFSVHVLVICKGFGDFEMVAPACLLQAIITPL